MDEPFRVDFRHSCLLKAELRHVMDGVLVPALMVGYASDFEASMLGVNDSCVARARRRSYRMSYEKSLDKHLLKRTL